MRVEYFERAHERNGAQHERWRRRRNGVVQQVHLGCGVDRDVAKRAQARVGLSKLRLQLCAGRIWCADLAQEALHRGPDGRAQQVRAPRESGVGRCDECEWDVCEHQRGHDERGSLVYFQWSFDGAVHGFMIRLTSVLSDPPEDGRIIDSMRSLLSFFTSVTNFSLASLRRMSARETIGQLRGLPYYLLVGQSRISVKIGQHIQYDLVVFFAVGAVMTIAQPDAGHP